MVPAFTYHYAIAYSPVILSIKRRNTMPHLNHLSSNTTVELAPFGRWTLRQTAAQRRSPPR
jgi:hypothetical protein